MIDTWLVRAVAMALLVGLLDNLVSRFGLGQGRLELVSFEQRRVLAEQLRQAGGRQALGVEQLPAVDTHVVAGEIARGAEFCHSIIRGRELWHIRADGGHELWVRLPLAGGSSPLVELPRRAIRQFCEWQVHVPLRASNHGQDVFQGGVQAKRGGGRDPQHDPQAVGGQKTDAVDVVGEPIRVLAHEPGGILSIRLADTSSVSLAEPDVSEPRVDIGDRGHLGERLANDASAARSDALDDAQILWTVSEDLEHSVAKALDRFGGANGPEVYLQSWAPGCWTHIHLPQPLPGTHHPDERLAAIYPGVARPRVHPDLPLHHSNRVLNDPPHPLSASQC
jgi:hypothetical protein